MPCAGLGPPAPGGVPSRPLLSPAAQTSRPGYPVPTVALLPPPDTAPTPPGPHALAAAPDAARQLCSYLPQAQMPVASFRAREAIEITGMIRGGDPEAVGRRRDELIEAP